MKAPNIEKLRIQIWIIFYTYFNTRHFFMLKVTFLDCEKLWFPPSIPTNLCKTHRQMKSKNYDDSVSNTINVFV